MDAYAQPQRRRHRNVRPVCDGGGLGYGRRQASPGEGASGLSSRSATRAVLALGAYVAQDLRDPDGVARPRLRRAALRLIASDQEAIRRLGAAYLRRDPPMPDELAAGPAPAEPAQLPPGVQDQPARLPATYPNDPQAAV